MHLISLELSVLGVLTNNDLPTNPNKGSSLLSKWNS